MIAVGQELGPDVRGQNLDCDDPVQPRVLRAVHFPHATGADGGQDFVGTQSVTRCEQQNPSLLHLRVHFHF